MFENLPKITEESYRVFVDQELLEVLNNMNECMRALREQNKCLAQAIDAGAATACDGLEGDIKEVVRADAAAAQLAVLRLIDRAIEAKRLEIQYQVEKR